MPTDVVQNSQRSPSPSAAHRVLREHIQNLMDTTQILDLALDTTIDRPSRPRSRLDIPSTSTVLSHLRAFHDEYHRREPIPTLTKSLQPPAPCAFLRPGQVFAGSQQVTHWTPGKGEHWSVNVELHQCDMQKGTICGTMTAQNVPEASTPVVTFFHGEIIDNINSSFYTSHTDWNAVAEIDLLHWTRFPSFLTLRSEVIRHGGRAPSLVDSDTIFMRWKEQFFVAGGECRLTIAGFYYVALNRMTGDIHAFYYDPSSSPDQRLKLSAKSGGDMGHSFSAHELA